MRRVALAVVAVVAVGTAAFATWWALRPGSGEPVGEGAALLCGRLEQERTGALPAALSEASGLVASRRQPGVLWMHNDSGDSAVVYAIDRSGAQLGAFEVSTARAVDWEDIAVGPPAGGRPGDTLYVGDIGDNRKERSEIVVYRVSEPTVEGKPVSGGGATGGRPEDSGSTRRAAQYVLRYPDGPHDAEVLLIDPVSGDLFVVTKDLQGRSGVFRSAAPLDPDATTTLEHLRTLDLGVAGLATGGDVSSSGDVIVIRTYTAVYVWGRRPGESVGDALGRAPCSAPRPRDLQGEAIGLDPDGAGYTTTAEGEGAALIHWGG